MMSFSIRAAMIVAAQRAIHSPIGERQGAGAIVFRVHVKGQRGTHSGAADCWYAGRRCRGRGVMPSCVSGRKYNPRQSGA